MRREGEGAVASSTRVAAASPMTSGALGRGACTHPGAAQPAVVAFNTLPTLPVLLPAPMLTAAAAQRPHPWVVDGVTATAAAATAAVTLAQRCAGGPRRLLRGVAASGGGQLPSPHLEEPRQRPRWAADEAPLRALAAPRGPERPTFNLQAGSGRERRCLAPTNVRHTARRRDCAGKVGFG